MRNPIDIDEVDFADALLKHTDPGLKVLLPFLGRLVLGVLAQIAQLARPLDLLGSCVFSSRSSPAISSSNRLTSCAFMHLLARAGAPGARLTAAPPVPSATKGMPGPAVLAADPRRIAVIRDRNRSILGASRLRDAPGARHLSRAKAPSSEPR